MATQATQIGSGISMVPRQQHGLRQRPRTQTSEWPLVATWATDTRHGPGLDITMALSDFTGSSYLPVSRPFMSPVLLLSTMHEALGLAFSPISLPHTPSFLSLYHILDHCSLGLEQVFGYLPVTPGHEAMAGLL